MGLLRRVTKRMTNFVLRRPPEPPPKPFDFARNPYKPQRQWPPDMTQMSHRHQFLLERRYKRRSRLKADRPAWDKSLRLLQWVMILTVVWYGLFHMQPELPEEEPFPVLRAYYRRFLSNFWSHNLESARAESLLRRQDTLRQLRPAPTPEQQKQQEQRQQQSVPLNQQQKQGQQRAKPELK